MQMVLRRLFPMLGTSFMTHFALVWRQKLTRCLPFYHPPVFLCFLTVEPGRKWPLRNAVCHMRRRSIMWDNCEERSISSGLVANQELHNATSILTWVDAVFPLYMRAKLTPERRCAAALCRFESPQTGWNKVADWSYLKPENVQKETVFCCGLLNATAKRAA